METVVAAANVAITHDKIRNLNRFSRLVEEAAHHQVDLLVLPEMGLQGYPDLRFKWNSEEGAQQREYFLREAETIPGPSTDKIRELAARFNMHIQLGLAESGLSGSALFNSTALVGPKGVVGVFRKIHNPFEWPYFADGCDVPLFQTPFGEIGSLICNDLCFPEAARSLSLRGAKIILCSMAWPYKEAVEVGKDYYGETLDLVVRANAFFNQVWLIMSNHCERGVCSTETNYYGHSQIVDPSGVVVAVQSDEEGLAVWRADLQARLLESRTRDFFGITLLQDRRPEHYMT